MQKSTIIEKLREQGFRITKQRELLIDIILSDTCKCCREVHFEATRHEPGIGMATVYRTVEALEKIGALKRRIPYQVCAEEEEKLFPGCMVELEDGSVIKLEPDMMEKVLEAGILQCGLTEGRQVKELSMM